MDTAFACPAGPKLSLDPHEIHLFRIDLDDERRDCFLPVLSDEELARASRFRTRMLQHRYARCRAVLRVILSRYEGKHPRDIVLHANALGKPELPGGTLHFNLSHSESMALIAVCRRPVGVDIECMLRAEHIIDDVAQSACHPDELALLEHAGASERQMLFYRLWTRKEAYSKAIGTGLNEVFSQLRLVPQQAASVHRVCRDSAQGKPEPFFIFDIPAPPGYAASVCLPFPDPKFFYLTAPVECPFLD